MSAGIRPFDFVQQVYYTQEKVLLEFWPDDDKYKEVLTEANLVLQELQKEEDWNFMRREFLLGPTGDFSKHIRTFNIKTNQAEASEAGDNSNVYNCANAGIIYKPCTTYGDCVKLYRANEDGTDRANDWDFIRVPIISTGTKDFARYREFNRLSQTNVIDRSLYAIYFDGKITFNRPLMGPELNRIAYVDIQKRFEPVHVCTSVCVADNPKYGESDAEPKFIRPDYSIVNPVNYNPPDPDTSGSGEDDPEPVDPNATAGLWTVPCNKIEEVIFTEIPDVNYMIYRTAYYHAMGAPSAQGRIADLQDTSQKLLSAMRENNASFTIPDMMDWNGIGYLDIT